MEKTLKIFATGNERREILQQTTPVAEYDAFVVVHASADRARKLAKTHLVEDISNQYDIPLESEELVTAPRIVRGKTLAMARAGIKAPDARPHHFLVQFVGPVKSEWLAGVKKVGAEPREPYGGFTYVVRADEKTLAGVRELPYVRWVGHLPHDQRIERSIFGKVKPLPRTRVLDGAFIAEFFSAKDAKNASSTVRRLGFDILSNGKSGKLTVYTDAGKTQQKRMIRELSAVHGVRKIRERTMDRPSNNVATGIMSNRTKQKPNPGLAYDGTGEVIGICDTGLDTGDPSAIHPDFQGRIAKIVSYPITSDLDPYLKNPGADDGPADVDSGHGTHVAGSVLGDGTASIGLNGGALVRGFARKAKLVFQAVEQETKWKSASDQKEYGRYGLWGLPADLSSLFGDAYKAKARIHSNSWGGGKPGEYDDQCHQLDQFIWDHKDFLVVVAAGNDGTDKDSDGKINPMSVTSPATAKNCLTVGASESYRPEFIAERYGDWWPTDYPRAPFAKDPIADKPTQIAAFSSRGPTADGRIKPDIVAPGTFILSTRSSQIAPNNKGWAAYPGTNDYFFMGGTSMATPLVSGAVAVVRQYLRTKKGIKSPSAALMKAALIAGATRLKGLAPSWAVGDIHQGFGRVNVDAIVAPTSSVKVDFLDVKAGLSTGKAHSRTFKVSSTKTPLRIVLAYSDFPGDKLVNNLNLIVTSPSGKKYAGNSPATGGVVQLDATNNVEVLSLAKPATGTWSVDVIGANVAHGPQDYALVIMRQ